MRVDRFGRGGGVCRGRFGFGGRPAGGSIGKIGRHGKAGGRSGQGFGDIFGRRIDILQQEDVVEGALIHAVEAGFVAVKEGEFR